LMFCPAAMSGASAFTFSTLRNRNLLDPCQSLASPKRGSTHIARFLKRLAVGLSVDKIGGGSRFAFGLRVCLHLRSVSVFVPGTVGGSMFTAKRPKTHSRAVTPSKATPIRADLGSWPPSPPLNMANIAAPIVRMVHGYYHCPHNRNQSQCFLTILSLCVTYAPL
jgi:hypothetical protein